MKYMAVAASRLQRRGVLTLPAPVRRLLGVSLGDLVGFQIKENGSIEIFKLHDSPDSTLRPENSE